MGNRTPVIIAGAGPSGLVTALWLKKRGVNFRLVERNSGPGKTSRALAVQARTLELYRALGLAEKLVSAGTTVKEIVLRREGKIAARAKIGALGEGLSPFPYLLFCSQDLHEEILVSELESLGGKVEWNTELTGFRASENGVSVSLKGPGGAEVAEADYLVGCDGAHSAVRHGLGLEFPGGTYSQLFFVADVEAEGEDRGLEICLNRDGFCIVMPVRQKGSIRLTGIVAREKEKQEKVDFADVSREAERATGVRANRVNWFSTYHVHHRVADHFRQGPVFLVGDAAHIHSPAGGQGMNTGIGDAVNLAWKLADVVQGRVDARLLDSYEPERIAFARTLVATTDTAFRFLTSRSVAGEIFRIYLLPGLFAALTRFRAFLRIMFLTVSQIRIEYRRGPISRGGTKKLAAGDRLPWLKLGEADNFLRTLDWQIQLYGGGEIPATGMPCQRFPLTREAKSKGLENALYLIRPDGYIAYVGEPGDGAGLKEYLRTIGWRG